MIVNQFVHSFLIIQFLNKFADLDAQAGHSAGQHVAELQLNGHFLQRRFLAGKHLAFNMMRWLR